MADQMSDSDRQRQHPASHPYDQTETWIHTIARCAGVHVLHQGPARGRL